MKRNFSRLRDRSADMNKKISKSVDSVDKELHQSPKRPMAIVLFLFLRLDCSLLMSDMGVNDKLYMSTLRPFDAWPDFFVSRFLSSIWTSSLNARNVTICLRMRSWVVHLSARCFHRSNMGRGTWRSSRVESSSHPRSNCVTSFDFDRWFFMIMTSSPAFLLQASEHFV
jgi:hypothetical protein